jgi:hypothetical protein
MSLLELLADRAAWERFYEYKTSLVCPKDFAAELRAFIDDAAYLPVCEAIRRGDPFPLPRKAVINKLDSLRRRVVYVYPQAESTVLKLLTWLLLRKYDRLFSPNLYSFRPGRTAKDAVRALTRSPGIRDMWSYKTDISDYFNSIPVEKLLPQLTELFAGDPALLAFLRTLLEEPAVLERGQPVTETKGIMAGTPLSAFYANLYLRDLDREYAERGIPWARYSDDILLFLPGREEAEAEALRLRSRLAELDLTVNPDKEAFYAPGEGWTFLGFRSCGDTVDIAPATLAKLKGKMRRKTRALQRWRDRSGAEGERAAAAFIRIFNRKLLEGAPGSELTWSRWFFSVINTDESLHEIDRYAQDCLRRLVSGRNTKGRYAVRYADLKALGYRSLVNAYYAFDPDSGSGG